MASNVPQSETQSSEEDRAARRERDAELVQQAQAGQMDAFDELVTNYRGNVYAMIVNMVRNEADAWDLAQDTFVKAWKALPKFEARSSFYTWIYRIAHNVTYDWLRKKKVQGDELDDLNSGQIDTTAPTAPKLNPAPDRAIANTELGQRIAGAIEQLSDDHRAVILLREIEGLSYEEIANVTACSAGTVMSRLYYARKKLQDTLKDLNPDR
ncbi:MAG: sigma-70 family RNA polymerase sigma factor [Verrucomicrobiota bacterium]